LIDHDKASIGYEIAFTKVFDKFRPPAEVERDILALKAATKGLIQESIGHLASMSGIKRERKSLHVLKV